MQIYQSTQARAFSKVSAGQVADVALGSVITPLFKGFGGCFNELGWKALSQLGDNALDDVLH